MGIHLHIQAYLKPEVDWPTQIRPKPNIPPPVCMSDESDELNRSYTGMSSPLNDVAPQSTNSVAAL